MIGEMKNCVNHRNIKASMWTGHIHLGKKELLVGYCQKCADQIHNCDSSFACSGQLNTRVEKGDGK